MGTPNKVTGISVDLAESGNPENIGEIVTITTEEDEIYGDICVIAVPYNATAALKFNITEALTLSNDGKQTDVSLSYRTGTADGFMVASNRASCTVTGVLTSVQKKISMKAIKNTTDYTITVAKGTPAGTETYFILYHNYDSNLSGDGYQVIRVVVY